MLFQDEARSQALVDGAGVEIAFISMAQSNEVSLYDKMVLIGVTKVFASVLT